MMFYVFSVGFNVSPAVAMVTTNVHHQGGCVPLRLNVICAT